MRIDFTTVAPEGLKRIYALQNYVDTHSTLDPKLVKLVILRASQINGCAFCMHMHSLELREIGETEVRIDALSAWGETEIYTDKERAALAWVEAITRIGETHAPDSLYEGLLSHFSDKEVVDLTIVATIINTWNRLAIGFRADPRSASAVIEQAKASRQRAAALI